MAVDLTQTSLDFITDYRRADTAGNNNGSLSGGGFVLKQTHPEKCPVERKALRANLCVLIT